MTGDLTIPMTCEGQVMVSLLPKAEQDRRNARFAAALEGLSEVKIVPHALLVHFDSHGKPSR